MSDETRYRLKFKKGEIEVDVQGDKKWVEEKFKELLDKMPTIETFVSTKQPEPASVPSPTEFPDSIIEFLNQKGSPRTHNDKAIVFSYWLSKKEGVANYNFLDIEANYAQALIAKPRNMADVMNQNQRKGYLFQTPDKDGKKAWRITTSGEKYVEDMG